MIARPNTIHRLLHLAKTSIATLHRVRRRRQLLIVQKDEASVHRRRFRLLQHRRQALESFQPLSQFSQLIQCRRPTTSPIVQSVHLVDDLTQLAQLRQALRDFLQRFTFFWRQLFLHEKITIVEQRPDLCLNPFVFPDRRFLFLCRRATPFVSSWFFQAPDALGRPPSGRIY